MNSSLIQAGSVVAALSLARIYVAGVGGYSAYCLLGGAVAYASSSIYAALPESVQSWMAKVPLLESLEVVVAVGGAVAYELAVTDGLSVSDFTSLAGLQRMLVGAAASVVGLRAAAMISGASA